jgi:hypothetical protein
MNLIPSRWNHIRANIAGAHEYTLSTAALRRWPEKTKQLDPYGNVYTVSR